MKPVGIVLRREEDKGERRGKRENDGGENLRYIVSTYINITMYPLYNHYMLIKINLKI
jgi:hypothetical protein